MNWAWFRVYVNKMLEPTLQAGDFVIMNDLPAHKVEGTCAAIEARGAELVYLPPHSLDLNSTKQLFAKLKALLSKTAARIFSSLRSTIGALLANLEPDKCANYIRHASHAST